jgi:peptide/nickel transport system substrate-binding protein
MPTLAVYEPLALWNALTGEITPVLAETVSLSEDRHHLSMELRQGITFTDDTPLNADGVKQFLDAVYNDDTYIWHAALASGLEIEVTGEYSLEFHADRPIDNSFGLSLGIASPTAYLESPDTLVEHPVGTGPYVLDEVVPEVSATYVRNPDYWNPDAVDFDTVVFRVIVDPVAGLNALKSGEIDAAPIPPQFAAEAENSDLAVYYPPFEGGTMIVIWDTVGAMVPALGDVRVRQAIAMAFDRESIVENVQNGLGGASPQVFPEGHPGHVEGGDERYPFDPERARELLAEAGYPDGFDLVMPSYPAGLNPQLNSALEPVIQQSLADIGIRVTYEPIEDFIELGYPVPTMPIFHWDQGYEGIYLYQADLTGTQWNGMLDAHARELLDAVVSGTTEESNAAWAEFGEYSLEQAWVIPVTQSASGIIATDPGIEVDTSDSAGYARLSAYRAVG